MNTDIPKIESIEIVEDLTSKSRCDQGFLRLRRLRVRNHYGSGECSAVYPCDIVSRPHTDAVAICMYRIDELDGRRQVQVLLKEGARIPIHLRKDLDLTIPDPQEYLMLTELVAGLIEAEDGGEDGVERRAAHEASEEAGVCLPLERVQRLGEGSFASPGTSDEKVFYCSADISGLELGVPTGDGSVMEEGTQAVSFELRAAIRACREGKIPDMKTELGLYRLADAIGYLPQLGCFVDELPDPWNQQFDALGAELASIGGDA